MIFAYTSVRYVVWALIIFLLHVIGGLTIFTMVIVSLVLVWTNYFFEKTRREKEFNNNLAEWLWLPILVSTIAFFLVEYVG